MNTPLDLDAAGVMLHSSSRSLQNLCRGVVWDVREMACSADYNLACLLGGRRSKWATVSRFQPRTVFWVDQAPSTCPTFLREMGSLLSVSVSLLGRNNL